MARYLASVAVGAIGGAAAMQYLSQSPKPAKMEKLTLKYWSGRGLMEVPRMLLAKGGMTAGTDFTDARYTTNDDMKDFELPFADAGDLSANLGRLPVLQSDAGSVGQSVAINYLVAAEMGLLGNSNFETARILQVQEHLKELKDAYRKKVPYGQEPTEEELDTFFFEGAQDSTGTADSSQRPVRFMKWYLGRIENDIGDGFAVGSEMSLADIALYNTLAEFLPENQAAPTVPQYRRESFGSKARMDKVLAGYPKIQKSIQRVAADPAISKYLANRGVQRF